MDNQATREVLQVQKMWDECVRSKTRADFKRVYLDLVGEESVAPNVVLYKLKLTPETRTKLQGASYYPIQIKCMPDAPKVAVFGPRDVYIPMSNSTEDHIIKITCAFDREQLDGPRDTPQFYVIPSNSYVRFDF